MMDEEALEQVAAAVLTMQDPGASSGSRQDAMAFVDDVKAQSEDLPQIGLYMATLHEASVLPMHDDRIRHAGLQFLRHCVTHRWETLSEDQQTSMKEEVFNNLLSGGTSQLGEEQSFIFEKIASIISEMAIREWPSRWPDFLTLLFDMHEQGITQAYVAMTTLHTFIETILTFNEALQQKRRTELLQSLTVSFPDILAYVENMLEGAVTAEASSELEGIQYQLFAQKSLETISAFLGWAPLDDLYKANLLPALCTLLGMADYRQLAADCLLLMVERKGTKGERKPLLDILDYLDPIVQSIKDLNQSSMDSEEVYVFVKRLAQVLAELASSQIVTLCSAQGIVREIPANMDSFLNVLYEFSLHPSLLVSSIAISGWISLLKTDTVRDWELVKRAQSTLFEELSLRVVRDLHTRDEFVGNGAVFCELDFSDYDDWLTYFHEYRGQLLNMLKLISTNFPTEAVKLMAANLQCLLDNTPSAREITPLSERDGFFQTVSELVQSWDAAAAIWEACVPTTVAEFETQIRKKYDSGGMQMLIDSAKALIQFEESDPSLLVSKTAIIGSFIPCLEYDDSLMIPILEHVFTSMEFRAEEDFAAQQEQSSGKTGLTKSAKVRRKACEILIKLTHSPPQCFFDSLESVCEYATQVLVKDTTSEMLRRLLLKALVSSFNLLPSVETQKEQLEGLLQTQIQDWVALDQVVASPETLIEYGGLSQIGLDEMQNRVKVVVTLVAVMVAVIETKPRARGVDGGDVVSASESGVGGSLEGGLDADFACLDMCELCLPNVFSLIRTLHSMADVSASFIEGDARAVLFPRKSELISLLHSFGGSGDYSRGLPEDLMWVDRSQLWMDSLRQCSYNICGAAAKIGLLYQSQEILDALMSMCGDGILSLPPAQMKAFFRHVICPFEIYLPRDEAPLSAALQALGFFYSQTASYLEQLFEREQLVISDELLQYAGMHDITKEQLEIINDITRTQLGEDVIAHLRRIFNDLAHSRGNKTAPHAANADGPIFGPIAQAILFNETTAEPILRMVEVGMCGNSSSLAKKTANLVKNMIGVTSSDATYHYVMLSQFIPFTLTALSKHGHHPECRSEFFGVLVVAITSMGSDEVGQVFKDVNVELADLLSFHEKVTCGEIVSMKTKRAQVSKLFQNCVGAHVSQWAAENRKVVDLPEKLFIARRRRGTDLDATDQSINLSQIFDDDS